MTATKLLSVALLLSFAASGAYCQIGNLDWIDGKSVEEQKDYIDRALQFVVEMGGGSAQVKYSGEHGGYFDDEKDFMPDIALGAAYRVFRSAGGSSSAADLLLFGSAGVNMVSQSAFGSDIDRTLRVLLTAGPEVGLRLAAGSSLFMRPFGYFGPGLSIKNTSWFEDDLMLVWVLRFGLEVQTLGSFSFEIGSKMIFRKDKSAGDEWYIEEPGFNVSEDDMLGFIGLRVKM